MVRNNHVIPKNHFKKDWKKHIKLSFDQPFRKRRRNLNRIKKSIAIMPRPVKGPVRPLIRCQSIRYNFKLRYGRGFSLQELKIVGLNRNFAQTIGISVDFRRKNKSNDVLQKNVQRLKQYMSKLVLYPKNPAKPIKYESTRKAFFLTDPLRGFVLPKPKFKNRTKVYAIKDYNKIEAKNALIKAKRDVKRKNKINKRKLENSGSGVNFV